MATPNLCLVNCNRLWGGGEAWYYDVAVRLHARGLPIIVCADPDGELHQRLNKAGVPVEGLRLGNLSLLNPARLLRLVALFRRIDARAVIFSLPSDAKVAGIAARIAGVRRIIFRRGIAIPTRNTLLNRFLFGSIFTDVIINSLDTGRALLAGNPALVPRNRIHLLYNGIDPEPFRNAAVGRHRTDNRVVLGHAGRLTEQKNQGALLQLLALLLKRGLDVELRIAGTGPLEGALADQAQRLGIETRVNFLGFTSDIPGFLRGIDIFVFSSYWEGFGYALVEAMAAGLPVVAMERSNIPEIVQHNVTGLLVPPDDIEGFADCVEQLASNPDLRRRMGQAGEARVNEFFTIDGMIDALLNLLERRPSGKPPLPSAPSPSS